MAKKKEQAVWRNRIVGSGMESPEAIMQHPGNWRVHSRQQQAALEGVLNEVGWVQEVIINKRTGRLVDGHLRVTVAIERKEAAIPVKYVDLTEEEESLVLATLDPIGAMAGTDAGKLDELLAGIGTDAEAVNELLAGLAGDTSDVVPFDAAPEPEEKPVERLTFTVAAEQAGVIREALERAKAAGSLDNGKALAVICAAYVSEVS